MNFTKKTPITNRHKPTFDRSTTMRTESVKIEAFRIYDAPNLDPITVMLDKQEASGSIALTCYGRSWTAYFGACGDLTEFFIECDAQYLEGKLSYGKTSKQEQGYLTRIIVAVQNALKERAR